jgi:hypothetical protein
MAKANSRERPLNLTDVPLLHKTYIMKRTILPGSLVRRRHLVKGAVAFFQVITSGLLQRLVPEFLEKPEIPGGRDAKPDA